MSPVARRVLHVIDSLAGSGGAENRFVDEVLALTSRFDQTVVRLYERDDLQPRLVDAGIRVVDLRFTAQQAGRTWPLAARQLRRVIREVEPDVVHTSLFSGNLVGQLATLGTGIPVVSTFNRTGEADLQRTLQPGVASWKGRVMHAVARTSSRRRDVHFRAVSAYAKDTNTRLYGVEPGRVTVVPRGVSVEHPATEEPFAALGIPDDVTVVVNVARVVPEKAQHLLVAAFARLRADVPDAHLVIAGAAGSATARVEAEIRAHDLGHVVHLLGHRPDARDLVAAADLFVLSSVSEGSPGVVLEAMALGTPVAAFAIEPVRELTDDGMLAWLATTGSSDDLHRSMVDALSGDTARVAAARDWAAQHDVATAAARLGDLLDSVSG